ncbi:LexA family transcriptional regulator [Stenotrophomonas maltophilia]|uniref:LexA family transcriptional regulator n=1 Tax=Stenotrophomonas maltophilia TaxID=40324 RepID=UPI000AB99BF3|nr:S24 family peptidase [Stenotrophomonas maltophilia]
MHQVKHSFTSYVNPRFIGSARPKADHQAMLDNDELARRIRFAFDQSARGTKARVAKECGINPQAVTGWERRGSIDRTHIPTLAKLTGRRVDYFLDVHITDDVSQADDADASGSVSAPERQAYDYVRVMQLDGEADMGEGRINDDYPEVIKSMDFTPTYIRSVVGYIPPPGRLVLVTGRGDSMIPVIQPGESLIVDTGITSFDGDGIYLINTGNGQQIKALQDRGEAVYVVSANTALYPAFRLPTGAIIGGKVCLRNRIDRLN